MSSTKKMSEIGDQPNPAQLTSQKLGNPKAVVIEFIQSELLKDKTTPLRNTDNLIEYGIIDSISIFKLVLYLEDTFSISIEDVEQIPDNFETINAISAFVVSKQM